MNTIIIDEAVNGFLVSINWGDDKMLKEVCESRAEVYKIIGRWLNKKMDNELKLLQHGTTEVI